MLGGILSTSQKRSGGGGIVIAGARNGLSIDDDGYVVLGNEDGDTTVAKLLDDRIIPLNGHAIAWNNTFAGVRICFSEGTGTHEGIVELDVPEFSGGGDNNSVGIFALHDSNTQFWALRARNDSDTVDATTDIFLENDTFNYFRAGIGSSVNGVFEDEAYVITNADALNIGSYDVSSPINFVVGGTMYAQVVAGIFQTNQIRDLSGSSGGIIRLNNVGVSFRNTVASGARIQFPESTAAVAAANFPTGVNKTVSAEGDFWYNGTNLYFRNAIENRDLLKNTGDALAGATLTLSGDLTFSAIGVGPIIKSPDGTSYRIIVADGGALSTEAA